MPQMIESELVALCAQYLRSQYGEQLLDYDILDNSAESGSGKLTMECTVRAGGDTSRWRKTFTFSGGRITDMTWRYLG
jgi:hypothetical protein